MLITAREAYINILTELVKEEAPTLYLEDYLYYFNKAISEYMKSRYEMYETNQQLADDMRFWKKELTFNTLIIPISSIHKIGVGGKKIDEYRHMLGCRLDCTVVNPSYKCNQQPFTTVTYKVTRMSSEIKVGMLDNEYLKPKFYRPYYENMNNSIRIDVGNVLANQVKIDNIVVEYLCNPIYVNLTTDQLNTEEDTSQVLEFTKDVAEEITKTALKLIFERGSNPRLQSNMAVNQSISDVTTGMKGGK